MIKQIGYLLGFLVLCQMAFGIMIETGDRIYFSCNNNVSGAYEGTVATMTCYDQDGNTDVSGGVGTNIAAGQFYYAFAETDDRYFCFINCSTATSIDYPIPVLQGTVSDIDDILTDTGTTLDGIVDDILVDTGTTLDGIVDAILVDTGTTLDGIVDAILVDTSTTLDNYVDGIEAKTDNLPADPCDDSDIDGQLLAIDNYIDSEVADILTDTGTTLDGIVDAILVDTSTTLDDFLDTEIAAILANQTVIYSAVIVVDGVVDSILVDTGTTLDNFLDTEIQAILDDTNAQDTAAEWASLMGTGLNNLNTSLQSYGDGNWTGSGVAGASWTQINTSLAAGVTLLTSATETQINNIETDTAAQDTTAEWNTLMATPFATLNSSHGQGSWVGISGAASGNLTWSQLNTSLANGITLLTSTTETQIDDILTDTGTTLDGIVDDILVDTGTTLNNYVDGIEAKTDNLPVDPADDSDIDGQLLAIDNYVDTEVQAILDNQSVILAAINVIDGIVDAILVDTGTTLDGIVDAILVDTAAFDTAAEYATAIWNAATGSYGGANTYAQAVEDMLVDTAAQDTAGEWDTLMANFEGKVFNGTLGTSDLTTSDNIGINADDVSGDFAAADFEDAFVETDIASILTDTGTTLDGKIDAIDNYVDTEVAAILANTTVIYNALDVVDGVVDTILIDTAAQDTAGEWDTLFATVLAKIFNGTLSTHTASDVDSLIAEETIQTSINNLANATVLEIDTQINASHSTGAYITATGFATTTQITNLANMTLDEMDLRLNQSHEEGNWSGGASGGGATAAQLWQYILNSSNVNQSTDQAGAILWAIERYG